VFAVITVGAKRRIFLVNEVASAEPACAALRRCDPKALITSAVKVKKTITR